MIAAYWERVLFMVIVVASWFAMVIGGIWAMAGPHTRKKYGIPLAALGLIVLILIIAR